MGVVEQLYQCTKRLSDHLKRGLPKTDRERYIKKIEYLLEERQHLIEQLPPELSSEETEIGRVTVGYDRDIQHRLAEMFEQIRTDVDRIQRQKTTNERYARPYQGSADGMFLDKRK